MAAKVKLLNTERKAVKVRRLNTEIAAVKVKVDNAKETQLAK